MPGMRQARWQRKVLQQLRRVYGDEQMWDLRTRKRARREILQQLRRGNGGCGSAPAGGLSGLRGKGGAGRAVLWGMWA